MTTLRIKVDRNILQRSKLCGRVTDKTELKGTNCAISLAVRDIFPNAYVGRYEISITGDHLTSLGQGEIKLPEVATNFIIEFDSLMPAARLRMPELEFEVEVSDSVLEKLVNLDEIKETLIGHPNLQLICG